MDQRSKYESWMNKLHRRKHSYWTYGPLSYRGFYEFDPKDKRSKSESKWMGLCHHHSCK